MFLVTFGGLPKSALYSLPALLQLLCYIAIASKDIQDLEALGSCTIPLLTATVSQSLDHPPLQGDTVPKNFKTSSTHLFFENRNLHSCLQAAYCNNSRWHRSPLRTGCINCVYNLHSNNGIEGENIVPSFRKIPIFLLPHLCESSFFSEIGSEMNGIILETSVLRYLRFTFSTLNANPALRRGLRLCNVSLIRPPLVVVCDKQGTSSFFAILTCFSTSRNS